MRKVIVTGISKTLFQYFVRFVTYYTSPLLFDEKVATIYIVFLYTGEKTQERKVVSALQKVFIINPVAGKKDASHWLVPAILSALTILSTNAWAEQSAGSWLFLAYRGGLLACVLVICYVLLQAIDSLQKQIALEQRLAAIRQEKDAALASEEFERCASLRDEGKKIADEIAALKQEKKRHDDAKLIVTEEDVADVVSQWTGVPVQQLTETEARRLLHLEEELHKRVISQDEAVTAVAKAIRRARAGLKDVNRPIGSFLFLGPSGVGKTELARTLARQLFGSQDAMIRIDMSEFMERYSVSRLVGAPPGYVGYEEGGELTDAVREKPYSVVLFDEVEKASGDFFNLLLQVLDEGRLTDSKGRTVDFRNTVIIMTSNLGASHLKPSAPVMGFAAGTGTDKDKAASFAIAKKEILDDVKKFFRPEFLNRIDEMLVFKPLETEDLRRIVALMLEDLGRRLQEKGVQMTWTTEADDVLVQEGTDFAYGARPLKRAIQKLVEDPIAEMLLGGSLKEGNVLQVDSLDKKELVFTTT